MTVAQRIVEILLETPSYDIVSVCAGCQKEFGTTPPRNASHGYCKRHTLEMYADAVNMAKQAMGTNPHAADRLRQLMASIRDVRQRPESDFCPDQSKQREAAPV
jgi:hypothetical protein